jgi:hypothetical protein
MMNIIVSQSIISLEVRDEGDLWAMDPPGSNPSILKSSVGGSFLTTSRILAHSMLHLDMESIITFFGDSVRRVDGRMAATVGP